MINPSRYWKACALDMCLAASASVTRLVHELNPKRIQTIAGHEVIFRSLRRGAAAAMRLVMVNSHDQSTPGQISLSAPRR